MGARTRMHAISESTEACIRSVTSDKVDCGRLRHRQELTQRHAVSRGQKATVISTGCFKKGVHFWEVTVSRPVLSRFASPSFREAPVCRGVRRAESDEDAKHSVLTSDVFHLAGFRFSNFLRGCDGAPAAPATPQ